MKLLVNSQVLCAALNTVLYTDEYTWVEVEIQDDTLKMRFGQITQPSDNTEPVGLCQVQIKTETPDVFVFTYKISQIERLYKVVSFIPEQPIGLKFKGDFISFFDELFI